MNKTEKDNLVQTIEENYGGMSAYIFSSVDEHGVCKTRLNGQLFQLAYIEKSVSMSISQRMGAPVEGDNVVRLK